MKHSRKKHKRKFISLLIFSVILFSTGFFIGNKHFNSTIVQASNSSEDSNVNLAKETSSNNITDEKAENNTLVNTNTAEKITSKPASTSITPNSNLDNNKKASADNVQAPKIKPTGDKEVFLTFDDGPSKKVTPQILKILDNYNVKASFFLVGRSAKTYPDLVKEEKAKAHAICNHTYSHNYGYLYSNPNNFIKDVKKCEDTLETILGTDSNKIIRFPGGGFYKKRASYRQMATDKGYKHIDWHVETGDARANHVPVDKLLSNLKEEMKNCSEKNKKHVVVLMHDIGTKQTTADALPQVIEYFQSQGYTFKTLEEYPF
ncbi:polysaccharide deacetylase [Clostridium ganghwense]|uniref:Polysaccharide deacetylase n=1 Tax=Clostridium ganghwense TaxID=312089 RepID=A0ABT4CLQ6_9CLOT|nr:polysaccharide deacetylase [Clostridium ganghwense]